MVWTPDEIRDQSQRTTLITGATDGIGREVARALAARKAHLVLTCRNPAKMATVSQELRDLGASSVSELVCDLSDLDSVRACATAGNRIEIDVLLLNAGISGMDAEPSAQGYDGTVAINHLGHFLLTALLFRQIRDGGRVVVVSSIRHRQTNTINWDAVEHNKVGIGAYQASKLANLHFVHELSRRLQSAGKNYLVLGVHPGFTKSHIFRTTSPGFMERISKFLMRNFAQPTHQGAEPLLMAATYETPDPADYFAPSRGFFIREMYGPPMRGAFKSKAVLDEKLAKLCWEESERLTNCRFAFSSSI